MKHVAGPCALAASIGAALLWKTDERGSLLSVGMVVGIALGAIVVAGGVAIWLRNCRRRAVSDMRDSALW